MGKKDPSRAQTHVDQYRREMGRNEFRGRTKRDTLRIRSAAQGRKSTVRLLDILLYVIAIAAMLAVVYMLFWYKYSVQDETQR
jgi:hypothetical protein